MTKRETTNCFVTTLMTNIVKAVVMAWLVVESAVGYSQQQSHVGHQRYGLASGARNIIKYYA